ncbi:hypothetical protein CDAR_613351 [Caerostris darwini]|uniref:Uncharacterized protein n=1 Tax=Caerostris darwini TaxID=1538125 RepID=A0AAV4NQN6_9ARAC|nr:hypothetical protein CDAR_613351 [Caerostris darwini]
MTEPITELDEHTNLKTNCIKKPGLSGEPVSLPDFKMGTTRSPRKIKKVQKSMHTKRSKMTDHGTVDAIRARGSTKIHSSNSPKEKSLVSIVQLYPPE